MREHNEDCFLVADLSRQVHTLTPTLEAHRLGRHGSLLLVADGMGGAAAGEIASSMAAATLYDRLSVAQARSAQRLAPILRESVEVANARIHEKAAENTEYQGMGTTLTAAVLLRDEVLVAQVGDSRAYVVRSGSAVQITRDQSLTQRLVDSSRMTPEEAELSERRNIILQALGPAPTVDVELTMQRLRSEDVLLLCSDGLSGMVRDDEIAGIVSAVSDPAVACEDLIELANSRGGRDNITVVLARVEGGGLRPPNPADPVQPEIV